MAAIAEPFPDRPFLVATRVHQVNSSKLVDVEAVGAFVERALAWSELAAVAIAVGSEGDLGRSLLQLVEERVDGIRSRYSGRVVYVIAVQPWGKFVAALNSLTQCAVTNGFEEILFASVETDIGAEGIHALRKIAQDPSVLCVGAAFSDHAFDAGEGVDGKDHALNGATTPWNTLALWHTRTLSLVGFVGVAEGLDVASGRADGGVEEVTSIAILQHLLGPSGRTVAKLARIPGLAWATEFKDDERRRWHAAKMASKLDRPAAQMSKFPGLPIGRVVHINASD